MSNSRFRLGFLLLILTASLPAQEKGNDWPQFRGPTANGVVATALPTRWSQTENLAWKVELPGKGTSTPLVVAGKIYLTCYTGNAADASLKRSLVCLDRQDGKLHWQKEVQSKFPEQATIREGHGYASNTSASDGERLYVFFGKSGVFAFDLDGKQLWQADVGEKLNGWGSAASLVLHGDLVIVNASVESESLVALDRKTGKEVWRTRGIKESWSTPIVVSLAGGKPELVVPMFGKILGLDPATGETLWTCATDIGWYMVPCLVAHDGIIYCIGGRSGGALAVKAGGRGDVTATHRIWTGKKGSNVSSPVYHQGHLYWVNDAQGIAYCAEAATGKLLYEERLPRAEGFYAAALLAGGNLYYVDRAGRTHVVAAKPKYEHLGVNDLSDRSMFNASPAVMGNRLLLRSDRHLYCIQGK
jgi:outer membrane protein assembly factor BamB